MEMYVEIRQIRHFFTTEKLPKYMRFASFATKRGAQIDFYIHEKAYDCYEEDIATYHDKIIKTLLEHINQDVKFKYFEVEE